MMFEEGPADVRSAIPVLKHSKILCKKKKTCQNCTLKTIHYRENIQSFFSYFRIFAIFLQKYMKNKIGLHFRKRYIPISHSE